MAKKKRRAKPSTKVGRRGRSIKRKLAKAVGSASGVGTASGVGAASVEAIGNAAGTGSATGVGASGQARYAGEGNMKVDTIHIRAPVPVTPTVYPDSPQGAIIVQNYVTINGGSVEFRNFDTAMNGLVNQLSESNEISGDLRKQLLAEIAAGREVLKAPKANRDLIKLLLIEPLTFIAKAVAGSVIGILAGEALEWLMKMLL